tara:strand:+ start:793 stop:1680 length:888 start_codon:yes stop_codon:yes gene_type:complete
MYDCIIIGGGMAGLSAAIYLRRKDVKTLMLTLDIGGRTNLPKFIENYPGFKKREGYKIPLSAKEQAEELGLEIDYEKVSKIEEKEDYFLVNNHTTKTVLLAFGKSPRLLGAEKEKDFMGEGIDYNVHSYEKYKNKRVAIIGAGNSAFTTAKDLKDITDQVTIIHRSEFRADETLVNEAKSSCSFIKANVKEFRGEKKLKHLSLDNGEELKVDNVIINIGFENDISFLGNMVKLNDKNEVIINDRCETSKKGIFSAGDCSTVPFKQSIISAGEGAKAALAIYQHISGSKVKIDWAH